METKKRNVLTIKQKLMIIHDLEMGISNSEVCKKFKIPKSTISTIFKNKDKIKRSSCSVNVSKVKKFRKPIRADIDQALFKWFTIQRSQNNPITGPILQTKAEELARANLNSDEVDSDNQQFVCTKGWLDRFKVRHNITAGKIHGEAASVSTETTAGWLEAIWPQICQGYDASDIFNGDETGLFYKMTPDKTLKFKGEKCSGGKQSKERITVWVCANMSGTEKRPLTVIGKSKRPRCFKNNGKLPVNYLSNKRAWVTSDIFESLLRDWDQELRQKQRKIMLIVDNCPAHPRLEQLEFIKLVFLPPNVTAILQPMDQGVIRSLKSYYRKMFLIRLISALENKENIKFSLLDAIIMISASWRKVSQNTIANCFRHAGLKLQPAGAAAVQFDEEDELPLVRWLELQTTNNNVGLSENEDQDELPLITWMDKNKFNLNDFITIDDSVVTTELPSDAELMTPNSELNCIDETIDLANDSENDDGEDESSDDVPTVSKTLSSMTAVSKFLHYSNPDPSVFNAYDKVYGYIEKQALVKNKVQNKMTDYFSSKNT